MKLFDIFLFFVLFVLASMVLYSLIIRYSDIRQGLVAIFHGFAISLLAQLYGSINNALLTYHLLAFYLGIVVVGPLVEEYLKWIVLRSFFADRITSPQNGFYYGNMVGLGFSASEFLFKNLLLVFDLTNGLIPTNGLVLAFFIRLLSHPLFTGIMGLYLGLERSSTQNLEFGYFYISAVLLHDWWNLGVILSHYFWDTLIMINLGLYVVILVVVTQHWVLKDSNWQVTA